MDITVLRSLLEGDARYATAIQDGDNGQLAVLLNQDDVAAPSKRWRSISADDFLNAIAGETLTTDQFNTIQLYLTNNSSIPSHKPGVRAWIQAQGFAPATITALRNLAEVDAPYCLTALSETEDKVSVRDVRRAMRGSTQWFGASAQVAARDAAKAPRLAVEAARWAAIEAAVDSEFPSGIRAGIMQRFATADTRKKAEVLLRVREDRITNP